MAKPAQLRAVEKLLHPRSMGNPDAAYACSQLAEDPRYRDERRTSQSAKTLAAYDRSVLGAAGGDRRGIGLCRNIREALLA